MNQKLKMFLGYFRVKYGLGNRVGNGELGYKSGVFWVIFGILIL
jgi:hypothetical protein